VNLDLLSTVAEIVAAVAVVISIIYLSIQVRQSNRQSQLQTHNDTLNHMHAPIQQMLAEPELAEIVRVGGTSPDQLSEADWFRFGYYYLMQFNMYEFLYAAHFGEGNAQIWSGTDASWRNVFQNEPGVRRVWREWRHAYPDTFCAYVDSIVDAAEKVEV
jgi:hypothetical protein